MSEKCVELLAHFLVCNTKVFYFVYCIVRLFVKFYEKWQHNAIFMVTVLAIFVLKLVFVLCKLFVFPNYCIIVDWLVFRKFC